MRTWLILLFSALLLAMLAVTVHASLQEDVLTGGGRLWPDPWFKATLADAYFAFLTLYAWIAYKERSWWRRGVWLVLVLGLGTMATSGYILWQLLRMRREDTFEDLLLARR